MPNKDLMKYEALVDKCKVYVIELAKNPTTNYGDSRDYPKFHTEYSKLNIHLLTAKVLLSNCKIKLAKLADDILDAVEEHSEACLNLIKVYCQYHEIDLGELKESLKVQIQLGDDVVSLTLYSEHLDGRTAMDWVKVYPH